MDNFYKKIYSELKKESPIYFMKQEKNAIISKTPEMTENIGMQLAKEYPKSLILLRGEMGAGKTVFAKGFAKGLKIETNVSSPSYTLMNEYKSNDFSMFHLDLYRLNCFEEVIDIGLFDILESNEPCLVEWAERIEELDKLPHLDVYIKRINDENREISWEWKETQK